MEQLTEAFRRSSAETWASLHRSEGKFVLLRMSFPTLYDMTFCESQHLLGQVVLKRMKTAKIFILDPLSKGKVVSF